MIRKKNPEDQSTEQIEAKNRYAAIEGIALEAGFTKEALEETEFALVPFFESITEYCAKLAEAHARNYDGMNKEDVGCRGAASAIRYYSKTIGNE